MIMEKMMYSTIVRVLTRVNGCENKFGVIVHTNKLLTNKKTRKKVHDVLFKEFAIVGMSRITFDEKHTTRYDVNRLCPWAFRHNSRFITE